MTEKKILILEDDIEIAELISMYLQNVNHSTQICGSVVEAENFIQDNIPKCIVLDLNLPGELDGYDFLKIVRDKFVCPIIIVSAREADDDIIRGLKDGADEFITKPFSPKVLVAKIEAILRRFDTFKSLNAENDSINFRDFIYFKKGDYLTYKGNKISLAVLETKVLKVLLDNPGQRLSSKFIFNTVWGENSGDLSTVGVHISRLRKKIEVYEKDEHYVFISNIYGEGYKFDDKYISYGPNN